MNLRKDKRSTMPAAVTYGFFIHIIHILDNLLKCLDPLEVYETWYICADAKQWRAYREQCRGCPIISICYECSKI